MLQIIGWLGCIYLVVKALEIAGSNSQRDSEGNMAVSAIAACVISWIAAILFSVWFLVQGGNMGNPMSNMSSINPGIDVSSYPSGADGYLKCNDDAKDLSERVECGKLLD